MSTPNCTTTRLRFGLECSRHVGYNVAMSYRIDAIFENGVFRPEVPVNIANGERVSLSVESKSDPAKDLSDVMDLLDIEFTESCRQHAGRAPTLAEVRNVLSAFQGSLADYIAEERDER